MVDNIKIEANASKSFQSNLIITMIVKAILKSPEASRDRQC
jgi:hypothetical protein